MHVKFSPKLMMRYSGVRGSGSTDEGSSCEDNDLQQSNISVAPEDREKEIEPLEKQDAQRLHLQRMKNSMRWNILRRTMSEDLYWAECQKNSGTQFNLTEQTH